MSLYLPEQKENLLGVAQRLRERLRDDEIRNIGNISDKYFIIDRHFAAGVALIDVNTLASYASAHLSDPDYIINTDSYDEPDLNDEEFDLLDDDILKIDGVLVLHPQLQRTFRVLSDIINHYFSDLTLAISEADEKTA